MNDWQPIETAPKDGTNVLLWWPFWCPNRPTIGRFGYKGIQQWVAPEALEGDGDGPTHWQPLPAPPRADALEAPRTGDLRGLAVSIVASLQADGYVTFGSERAAEFTRRTYDALRAAALDAQATAPRQEHP